MRLDRTVDKHGRIFRIRTLQILHQGIRIGRIGRLLVNNYAVGVPPAVAHLNHVSPRPQRRFPEEHVRHRDAGHRRNLPVLVFHLGVRYAITAVCCFFLGDSVQGQLQLVGVGVSLHAVVGRESAQEVLPPAKAHNRLCGIEERLKQKRDVFRHARQRKQPLGVAILFELQVVELAEVPPQEHGVIRDLIAANRLQPILGKHLRVLLRLVFIDRKLYRAVGNVVRNPVARSGLGNHVIVRRFGEIGIWAACVPAVVGVVGDKIAVLGFLIAGSRVSNQARGVSLFSN